MNAKSQNTIYEISYEGVLTLNTQEQLKPAEHGGGKPILKCPEDGCGKMFRGKGNLKVHLRSHMKVKPFKCVFSECDKTFSTRGNLRSHLLIHQNIKPFTCPYPSCGKKYINQCRLKVHQRTHLGVKPFICKICKKGFNEKGNLKTHERIHTGERPYACTFPGCSSAFKTSGHLKDHMKIHLNSKPYQCQFCSKRYSRSCTLKIHIRTHTGEKPFRCPHEGCSKQFSEKGNMKSHAKKHLKSGTTTNFLQVSEISNFISTKTNEILDINKLDRTLSEEESCHDVNSFNENERSEYNIFYSDIHKLSSRNVSENNKKISEKLTPSFQQSRRNVSTDILTNDNKMYSPSYQQEIEMLIDSSDSQIFKLDDENLMSNECFNLNMLNEYKYTYVNNTEHQDKESLDWVFP